MEQGEKKDGLDTEGLRQRNLPQYVSSVADAKEVAQELNAEASPVRNDQSVGKKTFGRTPDGKG